MSGYTVQFTVVDVVADTEDEAVSQAAIEIASDPQFYLERVREDEADD